MPFEIRPIVEPEVPAFREILSRVYGVDSKDDEESRQRFLDQVDLARTYVPFDGDQMVGAAASFSFDVSLPGGAQTTMGGLTMVAVLPTHRRRGLLNRMMAAHFQDCRDRGEALSGLWASESSIYGRYGFGVAAAALDVAIDAKSVGVPPAPDTVRMVDGEEARRVFPEIYDKGFLSRPGRITRSQLWWKHRHFRDPKEWRHGATENRFVVAMRAGEPVGYATYRQKSEWPDSVAAGTVSVGELFGIDADAELSLWSMICSIDLFPKVTAEHLPIDFELPYQVANPRVVQRRILDGLYVRLLDVAQALEARGYESEDALVVEVTDFMGIADGVFRLEVSPSESSCRPTEASPDVSLDVAALGALYLGGDGSGPMARIGRLRGEAGAVRRFGDLMRSNVAPSCPEVF